MRRITVPLLTLVLAVPAFASEPTPVVVPRSEQIDIKAKNGREYRLFIQAPAKESPAPPGGYPVYYFTDANASFALVASLARIQQPTIGPVVLVGIGYPTDDRSEITIRRALDLTPEAAPGAMKKFQEKRKDDSTRSPRDTPPKTAASEMKFGGQAEFFTVLRDEIKPLVEKKFAIDQSRQALFGHSFGGLFTLHAMYAHPDVFQTYIAASPSLFLSPEKLAEEEAAFTKKLKEGHAKVRLLVTLGGQEARSPTGEDQPGDDPRSVLPKRLKDAGVVTAFQQFEGENHGSVVPFAHMRGLRFAFETNPRPAR